MAVGLDDVVAAETVLSHVDGQAGRLVLRGFDLEELAGRRSYEAVLALLWDGFAPVPAAGLAPALGRARVAAFRALEPRLPALDGLTPSRTTCWRRRRRPSWRRPPPGGGRAWRRSLPIPHWVMPRTSCGWCGARRRRRPMRPPSTPTS